eukprot:201550_1
MSYSLFLFSLMISVLQGDPLDSCAKQNACLDFTINPVPGSDCQYEVCAIYNPKKQVEGVNTCAKLDNDETGSYGPSHVCYSIKNEDPASGDKGFCKACDNPLVNDLCDGEEPEETFCCGKCRATPGEEDDWCKEVKATDYDAATSPYGVCGGTINCWIVTASGTMATTETLFGFKDGGGCLVGEGSGNLATIAITGSALEGTVSCAAAKDGYCSGGAGKGKECGFSITIPKDSSCGSTPTPECLSDSQRLEQMCEFCTCEAAEPEALPPVFEPKYEPSPIVSAPEDGVFLPLAVYRFFVVQAVCWVLVVFALLKCAFASNKSAKVDFMNVKRLDDEDELKGLNA